MPARPERIGAVAALWREAKTYAARVEKIGEFKQPLESAMRNAAMAVLRAYVSNGVTFDVPLPFTKSGHRFVRIRVDATKRRMHLNDGSMCFIDVSDDLRFRFETHDLSGTLVVPLTPRNEIEVGRDIKLFPYAHFAQGRSESADEGIAPSAAS